MESLIALKQPASPTSITALSASQTALLIRRKEISPVEVMEAYLSRIQEVEPKLNAFSSLVPEQALAEARRAEDAVMNADVLPLSGIPISVKSSIEVKGLKCEAGSRLRRSHIAPADAPLVARLKKAGAIVLGNTSTPELLMAYHTENDLYGRTNNPWDLTRSPGGSSGGEAAAIAAGMSAAGVGSDGGGSIRVPANFCGICGLKPTPGRVPATGHYPASGGPFSLTGVVGPMARTVPDLRLLLTVMSGYDSGDPASSPTAFDADYKCDPQTLRIGYYIDDGFSPPDPEVRDAVCAAAATLALAGFTVQPFRPDELDRARELWSNIFIDACSLLLRPMVKGREEDLSPGLRDFVAFSELRPKLTGNRLLNTLVERDLLRQRVLAQMNQFPILLAPVCAIPAFKHEDGGWGDSHAANYARTMSYCQHYNLLGNPAVAVPVGRTPDGLPLGVQIIGRPYREDEVLAVAEILHESIHITGNLP